MSITTESTQTVSDILAVGRDHVAKGWCQGALEKDGGVCALGAINMAICGDAYATDVVKPRSHTAAWRTLWDLAVEFGYHSIPHYNNAPTTTQQDVLDWFDKAIAQADEKCL